MCGRYQLSPDDSAEIAKIVQQVQDRIKTGEIFPRNSVPVLANLVNELAPRPMVWGFPRFGGKPVVLMQAAIGRWVSDTDTALTLLQAVPPQLAYERA